MKILVCGDLHLKSNLGYSDYIEDRRLAEKKEILDFIISQSFDCDKVVFLGDNFNLKNNPSEIVTEFTKLVESFKDKEIFILSGNHESFGDGRSAIDYLKEINNNRWHIITNKVEKINNFVFCPYFNKAFIGEKESKKAVKKITKMLEDGDILFIHHAINGSKTNSGQITDLFDEAVLEHKDISKKYKLIIGGHIHNPQTYDNVIVAGSIFNNEIGELQKYIWKIDETSFSVEQIKLPGRGIYKLEDPELKDISKINKNSIVKVIINKEVDDEKKNEMIKELNKFDAYIIIDNINRKRSDTKIKEQINIDELSTERLLELYSNQTKIDIKKLMYGFELIK